MVRSGGAQRVCHVVDPACAICVGARIRDGSGAQYMHGRQFRFLLFGVEFKRSGLVWWSVHVEFSNARPVPLVMQSICGACRSVLTSSGCVFHGICVCMAVTLCVAAMLSCLRVFASSYPNGLPHHGGCWALHGL